MKHHLNVLTIALRVIIFALGVIIFYNCVSLIGIVSERSKESMDNYFNMFHPLASTANTPLYSALFIITHIILLCYLTFITLKLYRTFCRFEDGNMFYSRQGAEFRKIGSGIIIFAKSRYLILCIMGTTVYFDISVFWVQIPSFLALYLVGKIFLVLSYVSAEGESLKEENDLTI